MRLRSSATETRPTPPRTALVAALLGVAVTAGAVALAEVLTRVGGTGPGPVAAVAGVFIDNTPLWLKELAIGWFGTHDKLALGVGIGVVMLLLAVAAGLEERRRRYSGGAVVVVLGLVAALATVTRPDGGWVAAWPVLVSAVAGALVLVAVVNPTPGAAARPAEGAPSEADAPPTGPGRRQLLRGAGLLVGAAVVGAGVSRRVGRAPAAAPIALPPPATPAPATPSPATVGADFGVPGLAPYRTPNADFYRIDTAFVVPRVDAASWQLRVHGLVDREVRLKLVDLLAAPLTQAWVTLCCVSNEVGGDLVGNAEWLGLPVRDVLAQAGPRPGADMVLSRSVDGFTASTPLEVLTDGRNALLAVAMNGSPLPPEHGYPVRMVVPGLYGYVSATKWVSELEVTRFADAAAYWTQRGWAPRGPVKLSSRIDVPRAGRQLPAGPVTVAGVAWAQHTGIAAVEVRVDGGAWQPAELAADVSIDTWRQWRYPWTATPGAHTLEVRATDRNGQVQTGRRTDPVPDGATGWHRVDVRVA
ncbi:molybdopterin-dependent oxidoreductase [Georgenia ruanii]|uniref:Molybdopterin-dependent oxidoreductase n=1 Tax=Georgenia ruanii TaxID=348442 RepID=A0A7J9V022_9MICO|nr:molybdopterin-dependent oxidoreductase [Georgenia ruanii]MPV90245.1 molybdopterin-dependent oxidoreductase [Georgenia ruanii]